MESDDDLVEKRREYIKLSWKIIGYKLMYYYPEQVHPSWHFDLDITDHIYDIREKEYLRLCLELDEPNTVAGQTEVDGVSVRGEGMTELDLEKPSVQLALSKYKRRKLK